MAATVQGARLTEQHRKAQLAIRAAALRETLRLWPALDPLRLDDTAPLWLRLMLALVGQWRSASARRAQEYYRAFREVETGDRLVEAVSALPDEVDPRQLVTSLSVTGPVRIKYLTERAVEPETASRMALRDVSGAAGRHVLEGGRGMVDRLALVDERAIGWARVTDGDPCAFCAMAAGRGFVFRSREAALRTTARSKRGPGQKWHDGCGCGAEPAFSRDAPLPGKGAEYAQLWQDVAGGKSAAEARRAFRRAFEGRSPVGPSGSGAAPRRGRIVPPPAPKRDRRREVTAEIAGLSKSFAGLQQRKDAGEDVDKPYMWQRDRIAKLRRELAQLGD